jgi:hypothetical protein
MNLSFESSSKLRLLQGLRNKISVNGGITLANSGFAGHKEISRVRITGRKVL